MVLLANILQEAVEAVVVVDPLTTELEVVVDGVLDLVVVTVLGEALDAALDWAVVLAWMTVLEALDDGVVDLVTTLRLSCTTATDELLEDVEDD